MSIFIAARKELLDNAELYALVGERVYQLRLPDNAVYPCISFFRVSNPSDNLIDKFSPRFQFDIWSRSIYEAHDIADMVRQTFNRFKGNLGGTKPVKQGKYENQIEDYEKDTGLYHVIVDVFFYYLEN